MRIVKKIILIFTLVCLLGLASCDKEVIYTLELDARGATLKENTLEIKEGESYTLPELQQIGYLFGGWYYDESYSEKCEKTLIITENTKVYAKWTKKDAEALTLKERHALNTESINKFREYRNISSNLYYTSIYSDASAMCQNFGISQEDFVGCIKDNITIYAFELKNATKESYGNSNVLYRYLGSNIYVADSYGLAYFINGQILEEDNVIYSSDEKSILIGKINSTNKNIVINKNVEKIEQGAFTRSTIESIDLSSTSITKIPYYAFSNCTSLRQVVLPDSLQEVGDYAFANSAVEQVVFPSGVEKIGSYAYFSCKKLKEVVFSENIKEIGKVVFNDCISLEKVKGLSNLPYIGDRMFYNCKALKEVDLGGKIEKIIKLAFGGCTGITNIYIPENVKEIEETAFIGMTSLTNIEVAIENKNFVSENGVLFDNNQELLICYPIAKADETYIMPNSVKTLAEGAFYIAQNLKEVTLSTSLEMISKTCFYYCQKLESITIPVTVKEINEASFVGCDKLKEITFEKGSMLTKINNNAFYQCQLLEEVILPDNLTYIGEYAFSDCLALKKVVFNNQVTEIASHAFYHCRSLTNVILPTSLQKIGDNGFAYCTALESIVIYDQITSINPNAFEGNTKLNIYIDILEENIKLETKWNLGLPTYYQGTWELVEGLPVLKK